MSLAGSTDEEAFQEIIHPQPPTEDNPLKSMLNNEDKSLTVVQKFYSGANIFVTGATGFMGKVLLEKLLWACPDINAIYILVRNKKGKTVDERVDHLVSSPCFDRLRDHRGPGFKTKLIAVQGDIGEVGLGLSDQDRQLLTEHVNIVFHVAATVRFEEEISMAIKLNVRGIREVLQLCRMCSGLKAVVHVSTAYSNCPSVDIEERFYDTPLDCDRAIHMAETILPEALGAMTNKLLGDWPNTYAYTKAIAEDVVRKHGRGLPIGILRPSIVLNSKSEPTPGWIDSWSGPGGLLASILAGVTRTLTGDYRLETSLVPCDMVINGIIASAWDIGHHWSKTGETPVYNFVSSKSNPVTFNMYVSLYIEQMKKRPYSGAMWTPFYTVVSNKYITLLHYVILHYIPGLLIDLALKLSGNKPYLMGMYKKLHLSTRVLFYFCSRQWNFEEKNLPALLNKLHENDRQLFDFDMRTLKWDEFFKDTCPGLRRHLLKDDDKTIPAAKLRMERIVLFKRLAQCILASTAISTAIIWWMKLQNGRVTIW